MENPKKTFFKLLEGLYVQFGAVLFDETAEKVLKGGPDGKPAWPEEFLYARSDRGTIAKLYHPAHAAQAGIVTFRRFDNQLAELCGGTERCELNLMRVPVFLPAACSRADDAEHGITHVWGFGRPDPRGKGRPNTAQEYSGIREDREPGTSYVRRWLDDTSAVQSEPMVWRGFTPIYVAIGGVDAGAYKIITEWTQDFVMIKAAPVSMDHAEIPEALKAWAIKNLRVQERTTAPAEV